MSKWRDGIRSAVQQASDRFAPARAAQSAAAAAQPAAAAAAAGAAGATGSQVIGVAGITTVGSGQGIVLIDNQPQQATLNYINGSELAGMIPPAQAASVLPPLSALAPAAPAAPAAPVAPAAPSMDE